MPPGLSGAAVIRDDRREVIGVIFEEQTTTMYERTVIFGRAHHLDVLRSARATVTGGGHWLSICREQIDRSARRWLLARTRPAMVGRHPALDQQQRRTRAS